MQHASAAGCIEAPKKQIIEARDRLPAYPAPSIHRGIFRGSRRTRSFPLSHLLWHFQMRHPASPSCIAILHRHPRHPASPRSILRSGIGNTHVGRGPPNEVLHQVLPTNARGGATYWPSGGMAGRRSQPRPIVKASITASGSTSSESIAALSHGPRVTVAASGPRLPAGVSRARVAAGPRAAARRGRPGQAPGPPVHVRRPPRSGRWTRSSRASDTRPAASPRRLAVVVSRREAMHTLGGLQASRDLASLPRIGSIRAVTFPTYRAHPASRAHQGVHPYVPRLGPIRVNLHVRGGTSPLHGVRPDLLKSDSTPAGLTLSGDESLEARRLHLPTCPRVTRIPTRVQDAVRRRVLAHNGSLE